jgi:hypothetical protein
MGWAVCERHTVRNKFHETGSTSSKIEITHTHTHTHTQTPRRPRAPTFFILKGEKN